MVKIAAGQRMTKVVFEEGKGKTDYLLSLIREGKQMTLWQQLRLTAYLSLIHILLILLL